MNEKLFTKENLEKAFNDGRLYDANELELDTTGRETAFEVWFETFHKQTELTVGDIVKITTSFLDEPAGILGYVYEEYNLPSKRNNTYGWNGVSIITENGVDLGGFSEDEQKSYLKFIRKSGYIYTFKNVIQLDRDFKSLIKPLF